MALRNNHYDAAFEEFLRARKTPHVVVDEKRRALLQEVSLKSMDFIVYSSRAHNLLVDVKGRKFPSGARRGGHKWENWTTDDDLKSLMIWQEVFGGDFRACLVFAYDIVDDRLLDELSAPFAYGTRVYSFYGIWVDEYSAQMRTRSASWETVSLPSRIFRQLRAPIAEFL